MVGLAVPKAPGGLTLSNEAAPLVGPPTAADAHPIARARDPPVRELDGLGVEKVGGIVGGVLSAESLKHRQGLCERPVLHQRGRPAGRDLTGRGGIGVFPSRAPRTTMGVPPAPQITSPAPASLPDPLHLQWTALSSELGFDSMCPGEELPRFRQRNLQPLQAPGGLYFVGLKRRQVWLGGVSSKPVDG